MPPKKLNQKEPIVTEDELKSIASQHTSPESRLQAAASSAEAALNAQKTASSLRSAADAMKDPKKREKYLQDAYNKEIEAHGNSKKARVLSSGAFQGSVGGGGIGMAVGAGLGTVVGTLVGTVATIPATAVGGLVGAGVGGVHGPWIKLGKSGKKEEQKDGGDKGDEKEEGGEEDLDVEDAVPNPELLRQAADDLAKERKEGGQAGGEKKADTQNTEKKKPRKLEVRGKQAASARK